ncbi:MAG: M15 family metallopeptidase [Saprospiraceae bacterium]
MKKTVFLFLSIILALFTQCGEQAPTLRSQATTSLVESDTVSEVVADTLPPKKEKMQGKEEPEVIRLYSQEVNRAGAPLPITSADNMNDEGWIRYLSGGFNPEEDDRFVLIGPPYADATGMYLRRETFEAFQAMYQAARKDGIQLRIISATRNFDRQKAIWEKKWKRYELSHPAPKDRALKILEYSSMPGSSRHHWGTDIDLNDLENSSFENGGRYERVYKWLSEHAHEYGFCQPYTPKGENRPNGYNEEKWHWSFTPLSRVFLQEYQNRVKIEMFRGFQGAESAAEVEIIKHYVLGINRACK